MSAIKAFIGHSFNETDKPIVAKFIESFEALVGAIPGFSWDHAEEAEPSSVSQKVLEKIRDKNVFIGICTPNERVIETELLRKVPLSSKVWAPVTDLKWKTSDWIIQEIGLAIGRNMKVILLVEEGVRKPGGLFGDVEYIPFPRNAPEKSINKLLQMLAALTPKDASTSPGEAKATTSDKKEVEPISADHDPKPDWTQKHYEDAIFHMIVTDNVEGFQLIDAAYRASPFANEETLLLWSARIEMMRLLTESNGHFEKLRVMADQNPKSAKLQGYKARAYLHLEEHEASASTYEQAATLTNDPAENAEYLGNAAIEYARNGEMNRAIDILEGIKPSLPNNPKSVDRLLVRLRELSEIEKDGLFKLTVMEQMIRLNPGDNTVRFSLAYNHSLSKNEDMALYHYLKIPYAERNPTTWNNLGVSLGHFSMPVKGVDAFQRAAEGGETLAMSNLGYKLLAAGFLKEAKQQSEKAISMPDYDSTVLGLATKVAQLPKEEEDALSTTLENVRDKASFFRKAGEAILKPNPTGIAGTWMSTRGPLKASRNGDSIRISGSYERPANSLAGLLIGSLTEGKPVVEKISYVAKLRGGVMFGKVTRSSTADATIWSDSRDRDIPVVMYFDSDGTELHVMENPESTHPTFYSLKREG
jgi:tetratricopeptide (TPR) repeat protein